MSDEPRYRYKTDFMRLGVGVLVGLGILLAIALLNLPAIRPARPSTLGPVIAIGIVGLGIFMIVTNPRDCKIQRGGVMADSPRHRMVKLVIREIALMLAGAFITWLLFFPEIHRAERYWYVTEWMAFRVTFGVTLGAIFGLFVHFMLPRK